MLDYKETHHAQNKSVMETSMLRWMYVKKTAHDFLVMCNVEENVKYMAR